MHLFQFGSVGNFGTKPSPSLPAFHLHLYADSTFQAVFFILFYVYFRFVSLNYIKSYKLSKTHVLF